MTQSLKVAVISVNRSGTPTSAISVQYATSDGSGAAGKLYTATAGTLQWAANDSSVKSIVVPVNSTTPFSGVQSFNVALSNPSSSATISTPSNAVVSVAGAATSTVQFTASAFSVAQNAGTVTISVSRSGTVTSAASVAYATADGTAKSGSNYTGTSGTLNWAANDSSNKTFTVSIAGSPAISANLGFNVNLATPAGTAGLGTTATAAVTVTPAPASTGNVANVLAYLSGLNNGSSHRVLSGQHADIWTNDLNSTTEPMDVVTPLVSQTGKSPAILGLVLNYATNSYAYNVSVTNTLANQQWSQGGMVMLSLYDNDPTFSYNTSGAPIGQPIPASAFHQLTIKTSAAYAQWHSQLDTYAAALHTLTDSGNTVLFRPFIEINGNWNWYGAENATDFIAVWQDMHDYLMNTKGLKNVLWIYNVNDNVGQYMNYYPGSNYVDIVGLDVYAYPSSVVSFANAGGLYGDLVATGKPIIFPEIGLSPNGPANYTEDNTAIINAIQQSMPNVVGFLVFNGSWAICNQNNASGLMNNPWIVNLSDLPSGI